MKIKWYLANPFPSRKETREWELKVEEKLGIELVNPFYDIKREDIVAIDAGRAERYHADAVELVERDLEQIRQSNGIVAVVNGALSYGTIMEIVYARLFAKPVYLIVTNGHNEHPWLKYHATKVFSTFRLFEKWLKKELEL